MRKDIQEKLKGMPELLSIGQVAEIFSIHPDTLRNWEKDGILVPLRAGKRGDRKYRPQDIEAIVDKMGSKLTLPQLEQFLWKSADILRGKIDSSDYKKYIFGLLFYKRISDVWDEEYLKVMEEFKDETIARADYNHRFQVPKECRWSFIEERAESIGVRLNEIFDKLTNANSPKLDKIFDDLDFANKDRFPNETLQRLINHFSQYNFGDTYINSDLLGDAYEYLIKQFAADAGKKGGEFYTPREVERVIIQILKPHKKDHIYDPTVGSGGFLLEAFHHLKEKEGESVARTLYLYGQELNIGTYAIAKINMFLHGLDSADIQRGDTLANPQFLNPNGSLKTFDICVANFPYSIKEWEHEMFKSDKYGRIDGYEMPPKKNADYAFVLHIIKSMNTNGRAGVVVPHGVLFKGDAPGRIREKILKNDLIDAVISMPPKLFYGVSIPVAILIFNKNKSEKRKNKVLFIEAEKDFSEGKNQNSIRVQDIQKIVKAYDNYKDIDNYARVVDLKEIEGNEYNLNVRLYIEDNDKEERINSEEVLKELVALENIHLEVSKKVSTYINGLQSSTGLVSRKALPKNWESERFNSRISLQYGASLPESKRIDGPIPVYGSNGVVGSHSVPLVKGPGIIVGRKGTIGAITWCESDFFPIDTTYYVEHDDSIDRRWLYYKLQTLGLPKMNSASGTPGLNREEVYKLSIDIPPIEEQRAMVKVFLAIDAEIQSANEIKIKASALKKGLMQDLLSGNKRVNV